MDGCWSDERTIRSVCASNCTLFDVVCQKLLSWLGSTRSSSLPLSQYAATDRIERAIERIVASIESEGGALVVEMRVSGFFSVFFFRGEEQGEGGGRFKR